VGDQLPKSLRQAAEAAARGTALPVAARRYKELKAALNHFGYVPREDVRAVMNFASKNKDIITRMILKGGLDVIRMFDKTLDARKG